MKHLALKVRKCCKSVEFRQRVMECLEWDASPAARDDDTFWLNGLPWLVAAVMRVMADQECDLGKVTPGIRKKKG